MAPAFVYAMVSVIAVSLIAVIAFIPFMLKKKVPDNVLLVLLSLSVGTLLGTVFFHFLPEAYENAPHEHEHEHINEHGHESELIQDGHQNGAQHGFRVAIGVFSGFLAFFLLEKFIHYHHSHKKNSKECRTGHGHAYRLAPINLIGDGVHNFVDGLVIAGSYIVSIPIGIAATISVIFHEVPQEIADFGILLYAGLSKKKALLFNFLSATTAILGVLISFLLHSRIQGFSFFLLPFSAGTFIYIAAANLVPELHQRCGLKETIIHILSIIFGLALMALIAYFGGHAH
ncbi:MAG TPA: ZIP family metal transporter [Candidatus Woesearchaeota archaeon]|nr:ZIP family metal transporter [Candidatus Woesearchaeota archaeon]